MRAFLIGLALAVGPVAAHAQDVADEAAERYDAQRVAYHVNGTGRDGATPYLAAMRNVQNHLDAVGAGNAEIAVVMHGDGLGLLADAKGDDALQTAVASLKGQGVKFLVCQNTLNGREISYEDDLYDVWEEDIVPSGVAELSRLQQDGYTYIKP